MIRHIVLIKFKPDVSEMLVAELFTELHQIKDKVPSVASITSGRSESPEKMERGYMHGFVVDLADWDGLQAYQDHPAHKKLGAKLVENAVSGIDGILCFDIDIT